MSNEKKNDIQNWWDEHPFTYGLSGSGDLVGQVSVERMDAHYFDEIERKFKKHHRGGAHDNNSPILAKLIDYKWLSGKKVLDIAVGTGVTTVAFARAGAEVTAIDITSYAVKQTIRNLEVHDLHADVLQMDAQVLSFPAFTFDFVNAWGCYMHMPDTQRAINESKRVLKKGGRILAYMYNKRSWPFWFNTFFLRGILMLGLLRYRFSIEKLSARYTDGVRSGGNLKATYYTPKQAKTLFLNAGFKNVSVYPLALPHEPDDWPMRRFPLFRGLPEGVKMWLARRWGKGLIVQAEK